MSVLPDMRHGSITVIGDVMLDRLGGASDASVQKRRCRSSMSQAGGSSRGG